jgi:hypothetical protein
MLTISVKGSSRDRFKNTFLDMAISSACTKIENGKVVPVLI